MMDSIQKIINGPESNLLYKYLFYLLLLINIIICPWVCKLLNKINKLDDIDKILTEIKYKLL